MKKFPSPLVAASLMLGTSAFVMVGCGNEDNGQGPLTQTTLPTVVETPDPSLDDTPPASDGSTPPGEEEPEAVTPPGNIELAEVELEQLVRLTEPIDAVVAPNGEWWVGQRTGEVIVVDPDSGVTGDVVLDIGDQTVARGERGLLGLAVDDESLYVNFTDLDGTTNVAAWPLDDTGRPSDEVRLLTIDQPFGNHNGGALAIGPDGHLYIGVGDGGSSGDPLGAGQDSDQILGSILRIDPTPNATAPYAIPASNPFADGGGAPEIFATGLRNPWRISFDSVTNDLWVADVGQNRWEEVTLLVGENGWGLGANLGWNLREGVAEFSGDRPENNVDPVFVYGHDGSPSGCSVTGGEVYRGRAVPELFGAYVFGDYCTGTLWAVSTTSGQVEFRDLGVTIPGRELVDFSTDPSGELVAMSLSGSVVRIVPA